MDDDDAYLDSLLGGRPLPLRGVLPMDSNPEWQQQRERTTTFAATPPDFVARRNRTSDPRTARNQRFDSRDEDPRNSYWKNNHCVNLQREWGTIRGQFPVLPPITELKKIKNTIFNLFTKKLTTATGEWKDKTEFFLAEFEDTVPAASIQADMATADLTDMNTAPFDFSDIEILDANLDVLPRGTTADFAANTRTRARFIRLTLTIQPRLINPGVLDIDAQLFPNPSATTVYVRLLLQHGTLHAGINKFLLDNSPKLLIALYHQAGQEFDLCIKSRYDAAPDPERYDKWLMEVKAKVKFTAIQQYVQNFFIGPLEGTETISQRLIAIKQRYYDRQTNKPHFRSMNQLAQEYQFLISEIKPTTQPQEIPELESVFVQAVSEDLRKKLVRHLHATASTTIDENLQRFNTLVQRAVEAEDELKTLTNIAERAAFRQQKPYGTRSTQQPNQKGPRTFLTRHAQHPTTITDEHHPSAYANDPAAYETGPHETNPAASSQILPCDSISHPTAGTVHIPICFMTKHNPTASTVQQTLMTEAILSMERALSPEELALPLTATSIVEGALQQSSGTRIPIKCFGCSGLPRYDDTAYHLWRNCPNKGDHKVWQNFQVNLKRFRDDRQTQRAQRQGTHTAKEAPHTTQAKQC